MDKLNAYLRLFRWPNLLLIVLTQTLLRYAVIHPGLSGKGLTHTGFFMLVMASVCVAAAGYAINDYYDIRIDRINKPGKMVLGNKLDRQDALLPFFFLNALALGLSAWISLNISYWPLFFMFLVFVFAGWIYSLRYKGIFLAGNVLVALLSGFVPLVVWQAEMQAALAIAPVQPPSAGLAWEITLACALFAAMTSLLRELIKDMEDIKGDARAGCRTIPVSLGMHFSSRLALVWTSLLIAGVGYAQWLLAGKGMWVMPAYLLLAVQSVFIYLFLALAGLFPAAGPGRLQRAVKLAMAAGILSIGLLFYYF